MAKNVYTTTWCGTLLTDVQADDTRVLALVYAINKGSLKWSMADAFAIWASQTYTADEFKRSARSAFDTWLKSD